MQTIAEILEGAAKHGSIAAAALHWQAKQNGGSEAAVREEMLRRLRVMRDSVQAGLDPALRSVSGRVGGQAALMNEPTHAGRFGLIGKAGAYALAVAECNACMGKIVAAPTARCWRRRRTRALPMMSWWTRCSYRRRWAA